MSQLSHPQSPSQQSKASWHGSVTESATDFEQSFGQDIPSDRGNFMADHLRHNTHTIGQKRFRDQSFDELELEHQHVAPVWIKSSTIQLDDDLVPATPLE